MGHWVQVQTMVFQTKDTPCTNSGVSNSPFLKTALIPVDVIRHAMAALRLQTDEQETTFLQGRTSRVCHSSQNKKRSNSYTQKANASLLHILFCPTAHRVS